MKYIQTLIDYIKSNPNWKTSLKKAPFNLKTVKECSWHPNWWMFVYNLFDSDLSNPLVRASRGTVLEITNQDIKVICYPYSKFDNYGSSACKDIEEMINWSNAKFQIKIDGILIKASKVNDRLYFFTNGSFDLNTPFENSFVFDEPETREMTMYGELLSYALKKEDKEIDIHFNKETGEFYCLGGFSSKVEEGSTLMFELTSPRNKIICKYKETKLWIHGYRDSSFREFDPRTMDFPFESPELLDASNFEDLKKLLDTFNGEEKEGCVVVDYSNPNYVPRCKIKCDSYLKLKFARDSAANTKVIFKAVIENEYDDLVASVPAIVPKVEQIKKEISDYYTLTSMINNFYEFTYGKERSDSKRKEWAIWCKSHCSKLFGIFILASYPPEFSKFEKKLNLLATKKKGYEEFKSIIEELCEYFEV